MSTNLTAEQITELRAQAARTSGPFINPTHVNTVQRFTPGRSEWASAILGRTFPGLGRLSNEDVTLLALAARAEPDPPTPPRVPAPWEPKYVPSTRELAQAEEESRAWEEWRTLRAALPVPVIVLHNYTSHRHYDGYVQGVEHIILDADLHRGRLHRDQGRPLCWTPSRAHNLEVFGNPGEDSPGRLPTCKACLTTAHRIAARPKPNDTPKPTSSELGLLRAVHAGHVAWRRHLWGEWVLRRADVRSRGRGGALGAKVASAVHRLERKGWVQQGEPTTIDRIPFVLTEAGADLLGSTRSETVS